MDLTLSKLSPKYDDIRILFFMIFFFIIICMRLIDSLSSITFNALTANLLSIVKIMIIIKNTLKIFRIDNSIFSNYLCH